MTPDQRAAQAAQALADAAQELVGAIAAGAKVDSQALRRLTRAAEAAVTLAAAITPPRGLLGVATIQPARRAGRPSEMDKAFMVALLYELDRRTTPRGRLKVAAANIGERFGLSAKTVRTYAGARRESACECIADRTARGDLDAFVAWAVDYVLKR